MNPLVLAIVMLAMPTLAAAAPDTNRLGPLFYTQPERSSITQGRAGGKVETQRFKVEGLVQRSGGKSTIWVNGQNLGDGQAASESAPVPVIRRDGEVALDGRRLRVGQALDTVSGEVADLVPEGAVGGGRP